MMLQVSRKRTAHDHHLQLKYHHERQLESLTRLLNCQDRLSPPQPGSNWHTSVPALPVDCANAFAPLTFPAIPSLQRKSSSLQFCPVEGWSSPVEGPVCPVEGSACPVEGPICPVEGPVCPVEGSSRPVEGSSCPVEGPFCPIEGSTPPVRSLPGPVVGYTVQGSFANIHRSGSPPCTKQQSTPRRGISAPVIHTAYPTCTCYTGSKFQPNCSNQSNCKWWSSGS